MEVPVNDTDRNGRPVQNLKAADFEVFDDGKKQPITGFEVLDQRGTVRPRSPGESPINPAARRHFLLLFDLSFGSPQGIVAARESARDFVVTRMKELDLAAVATYSVETGMRMLVTFTTDRSQLAYAIDTLGLPSLADHMGDPLNLLISPPTMAMPSGFGFLGNMRGSNPDTGLDAAVAEMVENHRYTATGSAVSWTRSARWRRRSTACREGSTSSIFRRVSTAGSCGAISTGAGAQEAEWTIRGQSWRVDSDARWGNTELKNTLQKSLALFNRSDCVIHAIDMLQKGGVKFYGEMALPKGEFTLRALIRNEETGRYGVSVAPLTVPDEAAAAPVVLPPLFVQEGESWIMVKAKPRDAKVPVAEYPFSIGGDSFVPAALADIRSGQETRVCLITYNFGGPEDTLQYTGRILGVDVRRRESSSSRC